MFEFLPCIFFRPRQKYSPLCFFIFILTYNRASAKEKRTGLLEKKKKTLPKTYVPPLPTLPKAPFFPFKIRLFLLTHKFIYYFLLTKASIGFISLCSYLLRPPFLPPAFPIVLCPRLLVFYDRFAALARNLFFFPSKFFFIVKCPTLQSCLFVVLPQNEHFFFFCSH